MMYKNTKQALGKDKGFLENGREGELAQELVVVKDQINQIRAKLTTEAAQKGRSLEE